MRTVSGMAILAAGYDRQSQERSNKSGASPAAQRAANRAKASEIAKTEELHWVAHFSEAPGTSAFRVGVDRPEFNRLLNECRMGRVNMVIVDYVSRFSRLEVMDAIPIVTELLNLGVVITSVNEGEFRKGNLMDLIHIIMRLDAAHNESKNKSLTGKKTNALARSLGGYVGKIPYGFKTVAKTVMTDEERPRPMVIRVLAHEESEAAVIRQAWRTIKAHKDTPYTPGGRGNKHPGSLTGIVWSMNQPESYVPSKTGKGWSTAGLKRVLSDPRIAGLAATTEYHTGADGQPTRNVAGYRIKRDPVTMRPVPLECGPIISPDEWYELQEWLQGRKRGAGLSRNSTIFSGIELLYCECGAPMVGHGRNGEFAARSAYRCSRRKRELGQHEGAVTIVQKWLHDYVARRIFALIQTAEGDEDTQAILAEATAAFGKLSEASQTAGERAALVGERADATSALEELYEDRAAGGYSGAIGRKHFLRAEAELNARISGAESRLAQIEADSNPHLPIAEWMPEEQGADPIGPGSWWYTASTADRRAFVKLFVRRITVYKAPFLGANTQMSERVTLTWADVDSDEHVDM